MNLNLNLNLTMEMKMESFWIIGICRFELLFVVFRGVSSIDV